MHTSTHTTKFDFHQLSFIFETILCLLLIYQPLSSDAQAKSENKQASLSSNSFISWANDHAFPLQISDSATGNVDLQPLKKMVGKARVVALGEPAHGFHEPLAFRNRMFRFLVENCGFTTVVLEAGLAESRLAADYIAGGQSTAKESAAKLSIGQPASENIELLQWMREYNANPAHIRKLKFYGMDVQLRGFPGDTTPSHAALDEALAYLNQFAPEEVMTLVSALAPFFDRLSVANYPQLTSDEHDKLSATLDDLIAMFERERINLISSSSADSYEWAYRNALAARQTDRMIRVSPLEQPGKIPPEGWRLMNVRDAAMADNLMWILNYGSAGGKVFVFAHNAHVKNEVTIGGFWDAFAQPPNGMGQYLRSMLNRDLFIIGSSCTPSLATAQPSSLDRALLLVGKPRFILDLRSATGNPSIVSWLSERRPMEANSVSYFMLHTSQAFDALLFINKTR